MTISQDYKDEDAAITGYPGRYNEQMSKLLANGQEPIDMTFLMEMRIRSVGKKITINWPSVSGLKFPETYDFEFIWWCTGLMQTSDLWLRHPDKGGKVVPYNAQVLNFLREYCVPDKNLKYGMPLPEGFFEAAEGLSLTPTEIEKINDMGCRAYRRPEDAKQSPVWRVLARSQKKIR